MEPATKPGIFLSIRERLTAQETAFWGMIPIFVILFFWIVLTWGKSDVVSFPEGILDDGDPTPLPGRRVKDRTYYKIVGAKLINENDEKIVLFENRRFPLHDLMAIESDGVVKITLKEGKFIGREVFSPITAPLGELGSPAGSTSIETPSLDQERNFVGRGGRNVVPEPPPDGSPGKETVIVKFKYERVETRIFSGYILASPLEVIRAARTNGKALLKDVALSFGRVSAGFVIAFLITFPLGLLMGTFTKIKAMYSPLMVFGGYLPIPALVPLSLMFFGVSEIQKIMFLALAFGIYLLPLIVKAIEDVDNVYLQTAYTLGANRFQVMVRVLLGIAWPNIFDAMKMGFGVGWGYIILAEMVGQEGGVGAALILGQRRALTAQVYLLLLAIVVVAYITDKLWEIAGEYFFPYRSLKR